MLCIFCFFYFFLFASFSLPLYSAMDDLKLVLLRTFLVVLIQTLLEARPMTAIGDYILTKSTFNCCNDLDSHNV